MMALYLYHNYDYISFIIINAPFKTTKLTDEKKENDDLLRIEHDSNAIMCLYEPNSHKRM